MDCSLPGSYVHGLFQARTLEWVAISFSKGSSRPRDQTPVTCITNGLLHCRHILYWLSHQESLKRINWIHTHNPVHPSMLSHFSHVQLFETLWNVAHQAPPSMGFSRQEYRRGLSFPSPRDLPDPGMELASPASPALAGKFLPLAPPGEPRLQSKGSQSWTWLSDWVGIAPFSEF